MTQYLSSGIQKSLNLYFNDMKSNLDLRTDLILYLLIALILFSVVYYLTVFRGVVEELTHNVSNAKVAFALLPRHVLCGNV